VLTDVLRASPAARRLLGPVVRLARAPRQALHARATRAFRHCCAELGQLVPRPVFVKVGANDGVTGDPCSDILLAGDRWRGVLVEPLPYLAERLRRNFPDPERFAIEPVAIGSRPGARPFFWVDPAAKDAMPDLPPWYDQLGSFDRGHVERHLGGALAPWVRESTIEVTTLTDLLTRHGIRVLHLLHVDTEGADDEVLRSLDFGTSSPVVVYVEHKHLTRQRRRDMRRTLRSHGYVVRDCGGDYFALHEASRDRLARAAGERA
jgi:FkbM family methyltransferase